MTPATRIKRTALQVVLSILVAVPSAVALLDLSAETAAKVGGIAGALVIIVSAVQNGLESNGTIKTLGE